MGSVLLFAVIFHLNHEEYVTLLPKSITTAIGMGAVSYTHLTIPKVLFLVPTELLGNRTKIADKAN